MAKSRPLEAKSS